MSDPIKPLINAAADRPLTRDEARAAFEILFAGEATPSQIGGLLMALRTRGETVDEYAAAAAVMRAKCLPVKAPAGAMDIVGTGGDGASTFNISTASALVAAAAGALRQVYSRRDPARVRAILLNNTAEIYQAGGQLTNAIRFYRRALRAHCREVALARYTWDHTAVGLVELYGRLAGEGVVWADEPRGYITDIRCFELIGEQGSE